MAKKKSRAEERAARERVRTFEARQGVHEAQKRRRRRDNLVGGIAALVVVGLAAVAQIGYTSTHSDAASTATSTPTSTSTDTAAPTTTATAGATANTGDVPKATIAQSTTWRGSLTLNKTVHLKISLDGAAAPQAVSSTISLIRSGFYEGTYCWRLTTVEESGSALLQCGSPDKDGATSTDYSYGPIENAPSDAVYKTGTIAMARQSGSGYSQGSQFFIIYGAATTLPEDAAGGYTVIGTVTSGLKQLVDQVASKGTANTDGDGAPNVTTRITGATIRKG